MSDLAALDSSEESSENFDLMTVAQFEERLPDLFASGEGNVSEDPRFAGFLAANPDCAALVKDLETIAAHARSLFEPATHEPSDAVWSNIASKLQVEPGDNEAVDLSE